MAIVMGNGGRRTGDGGPMNKFNRIKLMNMNSITYSPLLFKEGLGVVKTTGAGLQVEIFGHFSAMVLSGFHQTSEFLIKLKK